MYKVLSQDSIEIQTDAVKARAADRKFTAKIVVGADSRQCLRGANRIVDQDAGELLQFALVKQLLRNRAAVSALKWSSADGHIFSQRRRIFIQSDLKISVATFL